MAETIKSIINKFIFPMNERIDSYFYVNRQNFEIEYNGLVLPIPRDGSTNVEFYKLFLEAHAKDFFHINDGHQYIFNRIDDEYNFTPDNELTHEDIDTNEFTDIKTPELCHLMATRYIDNTSLLFIDVTKISQFIAGKIFITFNTIKYFDEFFKQNDLTRIYRHYSNFYFLNYEL